MYKAVCVFVRSGLGGCVHVFFPKAAYQQDGFYVKASEPWKLLGQEMCLDAFAILTGCARGFVMKMVNHLMGGNTKPPEDGRKLRSQREDPKRQDVYAFFTWVYWNVCAPLSDYPNEEIPDEERKKGNLIYTMKYIISTPLG